jgi:hypothetical protein
MHGAGAEVDDVEHEGDEDQREDDPDHEVEARQPSIGGGRSVVHEAVTA